MLKKLFTSLMSLAVLVVSVPEMQAAEIPFSRHELIAKRTERTERTGIEILKRGPRGERGKRGKHGKHGKAGATGATGATGAPGPVNFIAPHDLFVDAATTQDQATANGTLAMPFSTVQAAINRATTILQPTNATQFILGTSIYIAGNTYSENPVINGTSNRITLVAMGDVILGTGATTTVTYNLTGANTQFGTEINPALIIESWTSHDAPQTASSFVRNSGTPAFRLLGAIEINNNSNVTVNLVFNGEATTVIPNTPRVAMNFFNSIIHNDLNIGATNNLADAVNTVFLGNVMGQIRYANECVFDGGLTLTSDVVITQGAGEQIGFINCEINNFLNANGFTFFVDAFTNCWLKGSNGLSPSPPNYSPPLVMGVNVISPFNKKIIGDTTQ